MSLEFIHTEENGIKYLIHPSGSIFAGIKMRENHEDAFDNAIKRGMKDPENWMYMYSDKNKDFFKHIDTRQYISFPQFDKLELIKKKWKKYFEQGDPFYNPNLTLHGKMFSLKKDC